MPDGTVEDRIRMAAESILPVGMFGTPVSPYALMAGTVVAASEHTNAATGEKFTTARINLTGMLRATVCWPSEIAPTPAVGQTLYAKAYLTVSFPELVARAINEAQGAQPAEAAG
jgi:hypothetical protein